MSNQLYFVPLYFLSAMLSANFPTICLICISRNLIFHDLNILVKKENRIRLHALCLSLVLFFSLITIHRQMSMQKVLPLNKRYWLDTQGSNLNSWSILWWTNFIHPVFCENLIKCTLKICSVFQQSPRETWTFVLIMLVLINRIF